jgi:saccharopine dehydrogenase (NAD+, L-lysine-forming)
VLGGVGEIGSEIVREVAEADDVTEVYIGDILIDKAKKLAEDMGEKASAIYVDVTNHEKLVDIMKNFDVVTSCVGPFYRFGVPVVKAAVEAGVNYIDIMDDPDPTLEILNDTKLNETASDAGVTVIIGLGSTPGLVNVLARYGASKLDEIDEISVAWAYTTASGGASLAVMAHMFHVTCGEALTYKDGKWIKVTPLVNGKETLDFRELGNIDVYHVGHPEPVTIPRYIKCKVASCKMGVVPQDVITVYRVLAQLGLTSRDPIKFKDSLIAPRDFIMTALAQLPLETHRKIFKFDQVEPIFECRVAVKGKKGGENAQYIYRFSDVDHAQPTYVPAAVATLMLGRGEVKSKGVSAPEGCIEPESFLKEVIDRGVTLFETSEGETRELSV